MAWTTKSSEPHSLAIVSKVASIEAMSVTSQGTTILEPSSAASGSTRFFSASP